MEKRGGCQFKNVDGGENIMIIKIKDICSAVYSGGTPNKKHSEYYDGGEIPWLNTGEIAFNRIYKTEKYISDIGFRSSSTKWVPANAVIVAMYGATAARTAITKIPLTTNQACCNLVVDEDKADYRYVYYYLCSQYTQLASLTNGGAQQNLNAGQIKDYDIDLPDMATQRKVADLLTMLDDKIEVNNEINKNLEEQAKAIFKSWFIDFEPFSNRNPSDWSVSTLGNVSIMGAGGDKPQNVSPIKTNLYEYPIYSNGLSNEGLYGFTDKPKISEESVTVSARGTIGFVCLRHIPYVPIVRLVTLIPKTEIVSAKYLYLWLKQLHITGTGTTQQQLTVPDFQKTEILVPSQEIVTLFTATVEPIFEKIWANQNENEKLSSLRDTLLPKLMSGEIDVSNLDI